MSEQMDISHELENQAAAQAVAAAVSISHDDDSLPLPPPHALPEDTRGLPGGLHRQAPNSHLSNSAQLAILRRFYAHNPNPSKEDLNMLAEKTGRNSTKIREYFRQRRNKLRGLGDMEGMEEPGRAIGWLKVTYRPAAPTSVVSQLTLYNTYKNRFDPYSSQTPLIGGQELIQLACATFAGCEMAKDEGDYVVKGLREKDGGREKDKGKHDSVLEEADDEGWERGVEALAEPLRAGTWLLNNYQHPLDPSAPSSLTQTDLYTSYAARFSSPSYTAPPNLAPMDPFLHASESDAELANFETDMTAMDFDKEASALKNRLLNPIELINLTKMTFPKCEPVVDDTGRFVIRGLERRDEKGDSKGRPDMFPFALLNAPNPSDPAHPFTSLLKRKLALLTPDAPESKRTKLDPGLELEQDTEQELEEGDKELVEGLRRFKGSRLGKEVRDVCVNQ
ncbi:hypothetical protein P7C73_g4127, partial [Tremellales sp. Uapishka_1]